MDRLKRSLRESFRRKKEHVPESSKPHQWQADEAAVRAGTCSFQVKYLGCVEVFESRGMQVCEEALKVLRNSRRRSVRGVLYVTADGLRVVDDESKGLIVDQTIEKVSFCAPDWNHEKGFSYICRDGTTRRWMCHGFLALKESGERLSHAVGCAFAACLERKQKRDKECGVQMTFDANKTSFTRTGSFRQTSLTNRMQDPQECKPVPIPLRCPAEPPVSQKQIHNPYAIQRPHATQHMLQRQGSCRVFPSLSQTSPFKRQLSLRVNDLPSTLERQQRSRSVDSPDFSQHNGADTVIQEHPAAEKPEDSISAMCQQLTQGLSMLSSNDDPFTKQQQTAHIHQQHATSLSFDSAMPVRQSNPWSENQPRPSLAEAWLASTTAQQQAAAANGVMGNQSPNHPLGNVTVSGYDMIHSRRAPHITHLRSQSLGSAEVFSTSNKPVFQPPAPWQGANAYPSSQPPASDPFDAEWAALATQRRSSANPFSQNSVKAFEVKM